MPRFNLDEYVTVQERIVQFWHDYPDGAIITELASPKENFSQCRYKASIYTNREEVEPRATGYAFEIAQTSGQGPNVTSHEENCETSAIGRALANLGYATTQKDRPSREEMEKVERGRPQPEQPAEAQPGMSTPAQQRMIHATAREAGWNQDELRTYLTEVYNVDSTKALTVRQASSLIDHLKQP